MEEHEYMTANTLEAWRTIVDAIFRGDCEIKRSVVRRNIDGDTLDISVVWDRATHIESGREYRWKNPAPPKAKILVDRTPDEFWPLIGKWWLRTMNGADRRYLLTSDWVTSQSTHEIAPLGTEDWEPMQKEIKVDV